MAERIAGHGRGFGGPGHSRNFFHDHHFLGQVLGCVPGGLPATLGIFLPTFVFVAISNPWIPRLRESAVIERFLNGENVASLALMAGAAWQTGRASVISRMVDAIREKLDSIYLSVSNSLCVAERGIPGNRPDVHGNRVHDVLGQQRRIHRMGEGGKFLPPVQNAFPDRIRNQDGHA